MVIKNSTGPEVRRPSAGFVTSLRGGSCFEMAIGSWSSLYLQRLVERGLS